MLNKKGEKEIDRLTKNPIDYHTIQNCHSIIQFIVSSL